MSKPTTIPLFDTNGTNVIAPTSGQSTDGFPTNAVPTSGLFNWLLYWIGQCLAYLMAQNLTGGVTIDALTVTAGAAIAGGAAITGGLTVDVIHTPEVWRYQAPGLAEMASPWVKSGSAGNLYWSTPGSGVAGIMIAISPKVGETITKIGILAFGDATHTLQYWLVRFNGIGFDQFAVTTATPPAAWTAEQAAIGGGGHIVADGYSYFLEAIYSTSLVGNFMHAGYAAKT